MGSTSINLWADENEIESANPWKTNYKNDPRKIYFIWRPAYERIVTGLHSGLADITYSRKRLRGAELQTRWWTIFNEFAENIDFESSQEIIHHTKILTPETFQAKNKTIIRMHQLSKFHLYLNELYSTQYSPFPHANPGIPRRGLESDPPTCLTSLFLFTELLKSHPDIIQAISARAAKDFIPLPILTLK